MIATILAGLLAPLLAGAVLAVTPDGPYRSIAAALAAASPGDTIEVRGGVHAGPLVVDRAVTLVGIDAPVLDGGGRGTVVTLAAPGAALRGFTVRASGVDLNAEDAGVAVQAANVVVADNQVEDVLNGISLANAPRSVIRGNSIRGKADLPDPLRGDGLRLWYSSDVLVEGNQIEDSRDCVIWYSANLRLIGNTIENGRYGLHLMYDDGAEITGNVLRGNSVGAYLMYSRSVTLRGNLLAGSWGPSGFGLGLKDVDDLLLEENWLVDNRVGLWNDNSPSSLEATTRLQRNVVASNDIALTLQPSVQRNTFVDNLFRDNRQQVSVPGGGALRGNQWFEHGRGNYWSDYGGFDANGDGIGDVPYRAEALLAELMDRWPQLRLFQFGLVDNAIEFAARAFPTLRRAPRLIDEAPLMLPPSVPPPPGQAAAEPRPALSVAAGLLALAGGLLALARVRLERAVEPAATPAGAATLRVEGLSKRYGRIVAVEGLTFTVAPGEVIALWGPNGAGKTTVLKCILGLLSYTGRVHVAGHDAHDDGKAARRALGYMPQAVAFHDDLTVAETVSFYARIKGLPPARTEARLASLGLAEHAAKPVGALSGGLRQRLALAVALLADPPLLLLDEPMSNLDAAGREFVVRLLDELRQHGTAIVLTSHRLEEIEALAARVLVLNGGQPAFVCPPHELAHRLGLRVGLTLRVPRLQHDQAVAVLRAAGLIPHPNGVGISVAVRPAEKMPAIRLLEGAGIAVTDFTLEESVASTAGTEE